MKTAILVIMSLDALGVMSTLICEACGFPNPAWSRDGTCLKCDYSVIRSLLPAYKMKGPWTCGTPPHRHSICGEISVDFFSCGSSALLQIMSKRFHSTFLVLAKNLWLQLKDSIVLTPLQRNNSKLAFNALKFSLGALLHEINSYVLDKTLPSWNHLASWLTECSPDELMATRTYLAITPGAAAKFSLNGSNISKDLLYACIPDNLALVVVSNRLRDEICQEKWWPKHGTTEKMEGEIILQDLAEILGSRIVSPKDALKEIIAKRIIRSGFSIQLPETTDCFNISPMAMIQDYAMGHFGMNKTRCNEELLPGTPAVFQLHSTPNKKTAWLFRKSCISTHSFNRLQVVYPAEHPLLDKNMMSMGMHPILFRDFQANIIPKKEKVVGFSSDEEKIKSIISFEEEKVFGGNPFSILNQKRSHLQYSNSTKDDWSSLMKSLNDDANEKDSQTNIACDSWVSPKTIFSSWAKLMQKLEEGLESDFI